MQEYEYAVIVKGVVRAPNAAHAQNQVMMGIALTARLSQTRNEVKLVQLEGEGPEVENGHKPGKRQNLLGRIGKAIGF